MSGSSATRRQVLKAGIGTAAGAVLAATVPSIAQAEAQGERSRRYRRGSSRKKGAELGLGNGDVPAAEKPERINALNPAWYYTWGATGFSGVDHCVEFVPMVWGGANTQQQIIDVDALPGRQRIVMGFNEPNKANQSNMSVDEALSWWPQVQDLAVQTVAPVSSQPTNAWMTEFFQRAVDLGYTLTYFPIHKYPGINSSAFLDKIDQAYETYGLPLWITEFAVADWSATEPGTNRYSEDEVLGFMQTVLPELEARSHVLRYSWFTAGSGDSREPLRTSRLFNEDGTLSQLGEFYAEFGAPGHH